MPTVNPATGRRAGAPLLDASRGVAYGGSVIRWIFTLVAATLVACGVAETPPAPPTGVSVLSVMAVENKTGSELGITGDTFVGKWLGREHRTVPDTIGRELESALRDRGFALGGGGPLLRIVLRRFEPDLPQLSYVTVAMSATLADPDGTVRWSLDRPSWVVSTNGAQTLAMAYDTAARTLARKLVDDWQPAR
jgi:hypothetical protein